MCYCFLTSNSVKSYKSRFKNIPQTEEIPNLDNRTDAEKFVSIYNKLNGQYSPRFKEFLDSQICRDCSTKITDEKSVLITQQRLKELKKQYLNSKLPESEKRQKLIYINFNTQQFGTSELLSDCPGITE